MNAALGPHRGERGDFTIDARVLPISVMAIGLGGVSALVAVALLGLISLFTNLFFFQRLSVEPSSPADHALGPLVMVVPVMGALIVGAMARFGSERIRGHGIPEAIEAILLRGSRVEPRVALLKPLSAAIAIGSGGPFGAEGPIIMTGGAFGSMIAQAFHLTAAERKTLLVSGAAAGMSAVFAAPVAATLLAIELLLFEWKPRSAIPVALASGTAAVLRPYLLGQGPIFPVPHHASVLGAEGFAGCLAAGALAGALSAVLTLSVYATEDFFQKLPVHWMWWPALGAAVLGVGGWIEPRALGVGYENIADLLGGNLVGTALLAFMLVKGVVWIVSLGSGTSGGVLAPLLTLGAALGGLEATVLPDEGVGFWPLVSMGAILGGTMRSPMTAVIFTLELTHDFDTMLPLLVAVSAAYLVTALTMPRSILTEKIARRGFHVSRELAIDPLEILFVREVMREVPADSPLSSEHAVWSDDILRVVVYRMAETGRTALPVRHPDDPAHVVGVVELSDLLKARVRHLDEERRRERPIDLGRRVRGWLRPTA